MSLLSSSLSSASADHLRDQVAAHERIQAVRGDQMAAMALQQLLASGELPRVEETNCLGDAVDKSALVATPNKRRLECDVVVLDDDSPCSEPRPDVRHMDGLTAAATPPPPLPLAEGPGTSRRPRRCAQTTPARRRKLNIPDQDLLGQCNTPKIGQSDFSDFSEAAQRLWQTCGGKMQRPQHHEVLMTPRALFAPCSCEPQSIDECHCDRSAGAEDLSNRFAAEEDFTGCGVAGPLRRPVLLRYTEFHDESVALAADRGELDGYQAPDATDGNATDPSPVFALGITKGNSSKCAGCEQAMEKGRWRVVRRRVGASRTGGDLSTFWHTGCFLRRYGEERKESTVNSHDEAIARLLKSLNSSDGRWRYLETSWLTTKKGPASLGGYKSAMATYKRRSESGA